MSRMTKPLCIAGMLLLTACSPETKAIETQTETEISEAETVLFHGNSYLKDSLSEETLKWLAWQNKLSEEDQLAVNYVPHELMKKQPVPLTEETGAPWQELPGYDVLLTSAPEINLVDAISSKMNTYPINSGSYSWTSIDNDDEQSVVACGVSPLNEAETVEALVLPEYNQMDYVLYLITCVVPPDRIFVREWSDTAIGMSETEVLSEKTYDTPMIELKKGRVYELVASWDKEKLADRGFAGEASYVCRTR